MDGEAVHLSTQLGPSGHCSGSLEEPDGALAVTGPQCVVALDCGTAEAGEDRLVVLEAIVVFALKGVGDSGLTRALLLLCAGEHQEAVRSALQTLAHARENANKTGEAASLLVLGDCFEALGREDDATAMRAAAKPPAKSLSPAASG